MTCVLLSDYRDWDYPPELVRVRDWRDRVELVRVRVSVPGSQGHLLCAIYLVFCTFPSPSVYLV